MKVHGGVTRRKVSVVMSVYNGERYLREAIESILSQTFGDFEFLIVEDGSTDATPQILGEYVAEDERVKVIVNGENLGLTKSLNKALAQAQGIYIARMDADDIAYPERLGKQVEHMENYQSLGLLGTACSVIDENGKEIGRRIFPTKHEDLKRVLIRYNPFIHSSVMMKREAIDTVGGYNEKIKRTQDYDLWFRISRKYMLANIAELLMQWRYTSDSISIKTEREQILWRVRIRHHYLKEYHYPLWSYIFFIKPLLMLFMPSVLRNFFRKLLLKIRLHRTEER